MSTISAAAMVVCSTASSCFELCMVVPPESGSAYIERSHDPTTTSSPARSWPFEPTPSFHQAVAALFPGTAPPVWRARSAVVAQQCAPLPPLEASRQRQTITDLTEECCICSTLSQQGVCHGFA